MSNLIKLFLNTRTCLVNIAYRLGLGLWVLSLPLYAQQAENLGSGVNSVYEERQPRLTPDGTQLYIWRRQYPGNVGGIQDQADIWVSPLLSDGSFGRAERLPLGLNSPGLDFVWQISRDTLFLSQMIGRPGQTAANYSLRRGRSYGPLRNLYIQGYQPRGPYKDFFLTSENVLIFPNESADGYGGPDLYVSLPQNDTVWGPPRNLGPVINTPLLEDAPFLAPDGKTLFFASNGHGGVGSHDLFFSTRLDDSWQRWSEPQAVGPPMNTPGYEADLIFSPDGHYGYFISDYQAMGKIDIFRARIDGCETDVFPGTEQVICEEESVELMAGFSWGEEVSYQWQRDGRDIPGATDRSYRATTAGTYRVLRRQGGCVSQSQGVRVRVTPSPRVSLEASSTFICSQDSILLSTPASAGQAISWYKNGLEIPGANRGILWVKYPGTYQVRIDNGNCKARSRPQRIGRIASPTIYPVGGAPGELLRSKAQPHSWLWTREFSRRNDDLHFQDLDMDPVGQSTVIGFTGKGRDRRETVIAFSPEGSQRWRVDGSLVEREGARFVTLDFEGNVFVTSPDAYLRKYSPAGRLLWERPQPLPAVGGITTDPLGHVYVTGFFRDSLRLEGRLLRAPEQDAGFLAKHDPWGKLIWVKVFFADRVTQDFGNALQNDENGNVYLAGRFRYVSSFDRHILRGNPYKANFFLTQYTPNGTAAWARKIEALKSGSATGDLHATEQGEVTLLTNRTLSRFSSEGQLQRSNRVSAPGGANLEVARLVVDNQGTVFIAGLGSRRKSYELFRVDRRGEPTSIWSQRNREKPSTNQPVLAVNEEGKILVGGVVRGSSPSGESVGDLPAFLSCFGPPSPEDVSAPIALCPDAEPLRLALRLPSDLPFYWMRNGVALAGVTDTVIEITKTGRYQVRAFSGDCERFSNVQEVTDCYGALDDSPPRVDNVAPPAVSEVPVDQPEPEPAPEPEVEVPNELERRSGGAPVRLNDRRLDRQGKVTVGQRRVKIYVWDRGAVDNDTISLNVNGRWLLQRVPLRKERTVLEYTFDPSDNNFVILFAHNLGAIPPNTAAVSIDDGIRTQTLQLKSDLRKCGTINIRLRE